MIQPVYGLFPKISGVIKQTSFCNGRFDQMNQSTCWAVKSLLLFLSSQKYFVAHVRFNQFTGLFYDQKTSQPLFANSVMRKTNRFGWVKMSMLLQIIINLCYLNCLNPHSHHKTANVVLLGRMLQRWKQLCASMFRAVMQSVQLIQPMLLFSCQSE